MSGEPIDDPLEPKRAIASRLLVGDLVACHADSLGEPVPRRYVVIGVPRVRLGSGEYVVPLVDRLGLVIETCVTDCTLLRAATPKQREATYAALERVGARAGR